jgi:hypothetical protein
MRPLAAIALTAAIALLCVYAASHHPGPSLEECLERPGAHDGAVVCGPYEATIGTITDGGFMLRWRRGEIPVRGTSPDLMPGCYVAVKGVFHKEGYLEALAIGVGTYRRWKMATSVIVSAIVLYIMWRGFRWDRALRALRERQRSDRTGGSAD